MFSALAAARRLIASPLAPAAAAPARAALAWGGVPWLARSIKVVTSLRRRCPFCYYVRRGNIQYINCKAQGRHKQRQGSKYRRGGSYRLLGR